MTEDKNDNPKKVDHFSKPKLIKYGIWAGIIFVVFLIFSAATNKPKGSPMYGICKSYLELYVPYPPTLQYTSVEQYPRAIRIYFSYTNPYGGRKSEFIECAFEMTPEKGVQMTTILLNREKVDKEKVQKFNETISAILDSDPDLTLPKPISGDLESLKR